VSFSTDLTKFARKAGDATEGTRRAVILELFGSTVKDTPVLTGRLRGNWQTSVGAPVTSEIGQRGGTGAGVPPEVMAEIMAACDSSAGKDATVYMRNNLPYAARIEFDGHSSRKAPAGMMRKNFARVQRIIEAKARRGGK
jgi:hypothetical protein